MFGGKQAGKILAEVYTSSNDPEVKRAVIRSYIISGDREQLAALAKGESNPELRKEAIRNLGVTGGHGGLQTLKAKKNHNTAKKKKFNHHFFSDKPQTLPQLPPPPKN